MRSDPHRLQEGPLLKLFCGAELYDPDRKGKVEVLFAASVSVIANALRVRALRQ